MNIYVGGWFQEAKPLIIIIITYMHIHILMFAFALDGWLATGQFKSIEDSDGDMYKNFRKS